MRYIHSRNGTIVRVDMPGFKQLTKDLGVDKLGKVQAFSTKRAAVRMDKYVPKREGPLKNTADSTSDPTKITYVQPYARNMYLGIDQRTGNEFNYNEAPQRGALWDEKMVAAEGDQWLREVQRYSNNLKER